jgi:Ca2+/Na+ antiporter
MAVSYRKFMELLDHWANHGVPQMLGTVISFVAVGLGVTMFINPQTFEEAFAFRQVFTFASPFAWGTVFIFTALVVLITVYTNHKNAQAPLFVMAATFVMMGLLQVPQIAAGGVPSGLFMYIGMGWVCVITQLICGARKVTHEKAPIHY